jgi:hypothetical protein
VSEVILVVAKVDVPVTASVPSDVREEVAVIDPPVILEMVEESAVRMFVKKLVVVAEVKVGVSVRE